MAVIVYGFCGYFFVGFLWILYGGFPLCFGDFLGWRLWVFLEGFFLCICTFCFHCWRGHNEDHPQTFVNIYIKTFLHKINSSIQKHSREKKNSKRLPCMASNNLIFCNEKYIRILRKRRSQTTTKKLSDSPKKVSNFHKRLFFFCCKSNLPVNRQQ